MTYKFSESFTANGKSVTVHRIPTSLADHIVDFKYTSTAREKTECINNPTSRNGYEMVAAISGGPYDKKTGKVMESCQIDNGLTYVEYAPQNNYGDFVLGVGIVNGKLKPTDIYGKGRHDFDTYPDMLRGGYRFSFAKGEDGTLQTFFPLVGKDGTYQDLHNDAVEIYDETSNRVGIGFKGSTAEFLYVETRVNGDTLKAICSHYGYDKYVNLDGGTSALMYADGETETPMVNYPIYDTFYLMKKKPAMEGITGWALKVNSIGLNIRFAPTASSDKIGFCPIGGEMKIKEFLPGFQGDGYQWAKVYYNGIVGYSQIDTYNCYTVEKTSSSTIDPGLNAAISPDKLYIVASDSGAWIRSSVVNGSIVKTVSPGTKMRVYRMESGIESDKYQWACVMYKENEFDETVKTGYVQMDTHNWHQFYSEKS